ncbi:MAG: DUF6084 family protein [Actinomycetota bacterium]|jgi:hypothetical protein|nr:DUF6084 family protein [Actinomycetota bacterium]
MTGLTVEIQGARPEFHAAAPTIVLLARATVAPAVTVHALVLRAQVMIEPQRRRYGGEEEERLRELFGETPRWGDTLRPFVWTHVATAAPGFTGSGELELPLGLTYDFEVAAAKYLHALEDGEIPLRLLFSGTVFSRGLSVEPVAWDVEAAYRLPVALWRAVMDRYFPNSGWVRLRRDTLDRLQRYRVGQALPTWDQALERLLEGAEP